MQSKISKMTLNTEITNRIANGILLPNLEKQV